MHAARPRAHHAQGRQEHLQVLRISHHSREGHCPHLLRAEGNYRRHAPSAATQRRPPSLRGPLQEVSSTANLGCVLPLAVSSIRYLPTLSGIWLPANSLIHND